jgi:hypothetical protein
VQIFAPTPEVAAATPEAFYLFALVFAFGYLHTPVHLGPLLKSGGTFQKGELESLTEFFTEVCLLSARFPHRDFLPAPPAGCVPKSGMTWRHFNVYNFILTVNTVVMTVSIKLLVET